MPEGSISKYDRAVHINEKKDPGVICEWRADGQRRDIVGNDELLSAFSTGCDTDRFSGAWRRTRGERSGDSGKGRKDLYSAAQKPAFAEKLHADKKDYKKRKV